MCHLLNKATNLSPRLSAEASAQVDSQQVWGENQGGCHEAHAVRRRRDRRFVRHVLGRGAQDVAGPRRAPARAVHVQQSRLCGYAT